MTLELGIDEQLWCCLASLVFGVLAGVLYDIFRIFYMCIGADPHKDVRSHKPLLKTSAVFVFDFLYCVVLTISFAVLMYAFSYGRFRLVFLLCSAAGFGAYLATLGRLVVFLSEKIVDSLKTVIRFILRCAAVPFRLAFRGLAWLFRKVYSKTLAVWIHRMSQHHDKVLTERIIREKLSDFIKL